MTLPKFLKERFPSGKSFSLLMAATVVPVHLWAVVNLLREIPALVISMSVMELIGVVAYNLTFTLLESSVLLIALVFLGMWLPRRALQNPKFIAFGALLVLAASIWAVLIHFQGLVVRDWYLTPFGLIVGIIVLLVWRSERLSKLVESVVERMTILAYTYVVIDILAVLLLIFRLSFFQIM